MIFKTLGFLIAIAPLVIVGYLTAIFLQALGASPLVIFIGCCIIGAPTGYFWGKFCRS